MSTNPDTSIPPSDDGTDGVPPSSTDIISSQTVKDNNNNTDKEAKEEHDSDFHGETHTIDENLFESLKSMGFSECAIKKSVISGCINHHTCVQWITMHAGHPSLEEPLDPTTVRVIIKRPIVLTAAEKEAKVNELKAKIAKNKEKEQMELQEANRRAERNRIETAKAVLELRAEREKQERLAAYDKHRREKEADIKAKEEIQMKLSIDKLVRKGKTYDEAEMIVIQEMKERKEKKLSSEASENNNNNLINNNNNSSNNISVSQSEAEGLPQQQASSRPWNVAAILSNESTSLAANLDEINDDIDDIEPSIEGFSSILEKMKSSAANPQQYETAITTIRLIISNIISAPLDMKKRNIKTSSNTFRQKITPVKYSLSFLKLAGFTVASTGDGEQLLVMNAVIIWRLMVAMSVL